ncbi:Glycosyl hydrolase family 14 protein [Trichomonas vaginalis G3]|uniref:Beta-amylase n=1 Tax=Trichomonas vaginalis (strain ATCC PRA-98 / G3) TaxID=412133 RepID=A2F7A0_TRIV3|nr:glycosyl hydrolase [Trichomonas vaginalis G3]EAX99215.1 Glycosyl hydrolase family 14 protein [Trichomonas vaginalis G3]KAI5538733.1 glycosidases domain-containing protein [Trichomonas vaginalis G3]|eukprot:XP_001312145.1 glycosyl hydrolase [Trichomonas vaginalis G3]
MILTFFITLVLLISSYYLLRRLFRTKKVKKPTQFFVMAPLDLMDLNGKMINPDIIEIWLYKLSKIPIDGIMIDVWWGITEPEPDKYNFDGYHEFFDLCKKYGLKIIPIMSWHACGGNVGDTVNIPLPNWVEKENFFYKDASGSVDHECISLFYDQCLMKNTTVVGVYSQFMIAFRDSFAEEIKNGHIACIDVGLGPCGECRYPGYRQPWNYPGAGAIQVYDDQALEIMKKCNIVPPEGANDYNVLPTKSEFWTNIEENKEALKFFDWYNLMLAEHADRVLIEARRIFGDEMELVAKIPGLHWWSDHPSHAAEATAGLYSYNDDTGYERLCRSFAKFNVTLDFSCLELTKNEESYSQPEKLVRTVMEKAEEQGIMFEGENALECYDSGSYQRSLQWSIEGLHRYTFLRIGPTMMKFSNWVMFNQFARDMRADVVYI